MIILLPEISKTRANNAHVDLALVLGVDISHSVDWNEYRLQRRGLALAIRDPEVIAAIQGGPLKKIAVTVVQWTGYQSQVVAVPWTFVGDAKSADRLSQKILEMERLFGGHATHVAGMIGFGARLLGEMPFAANRKVIDISGDGHDNVTRAPGRLRDAAVAAGITINGLAIENDDKNLRFYYRDFVIGGPGAFVMTTQSYADFGEAIKKKLLREISTKLLTSKPGRSGAGLRFAGPFLHYTTQTAHPWETRMHVEINPASFPKPQSNYSQGVVHNAAAQRLVISGQVGVRPDGTVAGGLAGC